ncbi:MAG: DNA-processing protein DprA [Methylocystaceae bacterium]
MLSELEQTYLLALYQVKGIGNLALQAIHNQQLSFQQVWEDPELLVNHRIIDRTVRDMLMVSKRYLTPEACLDELSNAKCSYLTRWTSNYPSGLEQLHDVPAVLYYQGNAKLFSQVMVAIVGSRTATVYGKKVAASFGGQFGEAGLTVVSGVARGIDSAAHRAALATDGSTIGVLGSGINVVYPPENMPLYQMIAENGLLLSEFTLGTKPSAGNFPRRNRIIAALAQAVVVVEANDKSGALITTDHALELGRDVWAVPGPITSPQSRGTNGLIRDGALLALEAGEIINSLVPGIQRGQLKPQTVSLTLEEGRIIEVIGEYPVHLDEIAASLDFPRGELSSLLLKLELKGIIICLAGNHYVRNN